MIHRFEKDIEQGILEHSIYDVRSNEFYDEEPLRLDHLTEDAYKAFPARNVVAQMMRSRLLAWRGYGNENTIYIAHDEDELVDIWWEDDMTLLNGAVIRSKCSSRDRAIIAEETRRDYRSYTKDWH